MGNYRILRIWQFVMELTVKIYKLTTKQPFTKDFGLKDQIQRSAVSTPSNIAEGDESGTNKISVRYFHIAKGSVAELQTQLIIACEIGYVEKSVMESLVDECVRISIIFNKKIKPGQKILDNFKSVSLQRHTIMPSHRLTVSPTYRRTLNFFLTGLL
jgi:four helix bundle protein